MAAKHWVFTWNNPSDDDLADLIEKFDPDTQQHGVQYIVFQKETGLEGTPHIQGYVQLIAKRRMMFLKTLIDNRIHLEIARGSPHDNKNYCTKQETRTAGPWEFGLMVGGQGSRSDIAEFVRSVSVSIPSERELIESYPALVAKYPKFVDRVIRYYTTPPPRSFIPRAGWQLELQLQLLQQPDARKVYWYWEAVGNSGKSTFALGFYDGRRHGYVVTGGRHSDIYYAYKNESVVFFDWARDNQDSFPYTVVENFKNGYFLNTKYETHAYRFEVPHVVIFANFPPDVSKLSNDRWIIKNI